MKSQRNRLRVTATVAVAVLAALSLALVGCGDDDDTTATATGVAATQVATSAPATPAAGTPAAGTPAASGGLSLVAGTASITLDGQMDDWADVPGLQVPLTAIPEDFREEPTAAGDFTATLKVATDGANIYVLVAVPDGYDFVLEDHHLSPALAVEWLIDAGASPHMGAAAPDFEDETGMVDIWHWELDCGPGELSGGSFPTGNDPDCNLDDEYATLTDEREDDDIDNSLTGSWDHTSRAQGIGADGTFVFEIARPLQTGDPQDAQFELGGTAFVALAYWDGNEGAESEGGGWTDAGHAVSMTGEAGDEGWIEVTFPAEAVRRITAPSGVTIVLDGQMGDWADVPGLQVPLTAIPEEYREDPSAGEDVTVTLKVATDGTNIFVLVAVPDGYDFVLEDHHLSPALAVEWLIGADASPHMGAAEPDFEDETGMVDIWHWELDCGPGQLSGGSFATGNDPDCNLDDEYATLTDEREDDDADNSLTGSWDHTARAQGIGADGTFVFEMARPLQTDDPQDAQFELGGTAFLALAYWDGNEGAEGEGGGWSDAGHVQSANEGWIQIVFAR